MGERVGGVIEVIPALFDPLFAREVERLWWIVVVPLMVAYLATGGERA